MGHFAMAWSKMDLITNADCLGVRLNPFSLSTWVTPNLGL
jgi:hypothetical protein